jgi:hypothetical protein
MNQQQDANFERYWGEKLLKPTRWIAGESAALGLMDMARQGALLAGDELVYHRTFGAKSNAGQPLHVIDAVVKVSSCRSNLHTRLWTPRGRR